MNYLKNKRCYLSAPIENAANIDPNWRSTISSVLIKEFEINLFDPFLDPKQQQVDALHDARNNKNHLKMIEIAKSFVRKDLSMVDRADFVIAYLPYKVPTTGCHHEIINSNNSKKPTLLVCDTPDKFHLPLWYYGFIPYEFMFSSWTELFDYLRLVNQGKSENPKWDFIYGKL
jgi:hypothetical protein